MKDHDEEVRNGNYDVLDPGIRSVVRLLREHGFDTTDSGDGFSKPPDECAIPFPHVAAVVNKELMFVEANRLASLLPPEWAVEATFYPRTNTCILLATKDLNEV